MSKTLIALTASALALGAAQPHAQDGGDAPLTDARQTSPYWEIARDSLRDNARKRPNYGTAKNVIVFVGDGMGPTTVTAGRIYEGQRDGDDLPGVRNVLDFEQLPHLALSKVYNTNVQIPDSAGTMTAMMTGVKTDVGILNYLPGIQRGDCTTPADQKLVPIFGLAEAAGLSTGVISTARLTHATPAATYANMVDRNLENDTTVGLRPGAEDCPDIASQLVDFPYGDGIELAMGGGRRNFLREDQADPEDEGRTGSRTERDLTAEWAAKSDDHAFVFDRAGFDALDPASDVRVLGLFERSHMEYELDRADDAGGEPSLAEMTSFAIDRLSRDEDGYVLIVEAGRIDHAHHAVNAARALGDTRAFDDAVAAALAKVDLEDTLVVVTADHGHVVGMQGYPTLDNDILGVVDEPAFLEDEDDQFPGAYEAADGKPYTTLSYLNGGSSPFFGDEPVVRPNPLDAPVDVTDKEYRQTALVPLGSETHGGQDVAIYAGGPRAYLFDGTVEQNYVYHVMSQALRLDRKVEVEQRRGARRGARSRR